MSVTADHRVPVFRGGAIEREDVPASELEEGDEVTVGNKRCQLVSKHHEVMDEHPKDHMSKYSR